MPASSRSRGNGAALAGRSTVYAARGAIETSPPLATSAGLTVLEPGGNAVDAAVTAAAVRSIVEPHMTGIGGDLFALVRSARERRLIGHGRSGSDLTCQAILARGYERDPPFGAESVTVPCTVRGWADLLERFGTITLAEALAPAIRLAEEGFPVSPVIARHWAETAERLQRDEGARATYLVDGDRTPAAGEWFRNPDYAASLRAIAEGGADAFYDGPLGRLQPTCFRGESMMRVRTPLVPVLCTLLLAGVAACADSGAAGGDLLDEQVPEAERYGGTLVIGLPFDIADVNPLTHQTAVALFIHQYVLFLGLVAYDAQLEPTPRLARSWGLDEEAGTLTFHLRDDVFWHDGVQTTAHDMQFAYQRARDPRTAYPNASTLAQYGESEVVDTFTWRVRLRPHAEYMDVWSFLVPLPRHLLYEVPPEQLARHPFNHASPVGNGPFRFVERLPGQRWVFEANPEFPAELGGRPYLDRAVFRAIPEATTMLTELLTGGIDFYYQIPPQDAERVAGQRGVEILRAPGVRFHYLGFNHRRPPFDDVRVRRALTLAIDRETILAAVLGGYGSLANSTISPWLAHHDPTAGADLGYDRDAARTLLAEAGFRTRNAEGVLQDEGGRPLRFTILTPVTSLVNRDAGQIIQAGLRQVGVDVRVQVLELNTLQARVRDRERYDFEAVIWSWLPFFRNDDASLFGCDDPNAYLGHCSPARDALLDSALAIPDRQAARPLWSRYQHRLAEELPMTFLFFPDELHAANTRLRGANPDARGAWVGIERWWIHPAPR